MCLRFLLFSPAFIRLATLHLKKLFFPLLKWAKYLSLQYCEQNKLRLNFSRRSSIVVISVILERERKSMTLQISV